MFHLSFHQYFNNEYGGAQGSGLRAGRQYVDRYPHSGAPFGRGEAWGLDCMSAAYSVERPAWRALKRRWFDYLADVLSDGQQSCNGFLQATVSPKFVGGRYRARQQIEQAISESALRSMRESVYRRASASYSALVGDVFRYLLFGGISQMAWFNGETAPWTYTGVGPLGDASPVWCSRSQMPSDAWTPEHEAYQNWSSFAFGYERTTNTRFLERAQIQGGGPDLYQVLRNSGTQNIENRAALLALAQRLSGDL
jgi:hypothetical protein